ncbi:MAG: hypothetical protein ACREM8_06925, partial [Vulcanimicrobiaceae bacterium]
MSSQQAATHGPFSRKCWLTVSALGSLALIGAAVCGASADERQDAPALATSRVWANVIHRNRGLSAYESAISMRFRESSFPFLGATLG